MAGFFSKQNFLTSVEYIKNTPIYEYDMKAAGYSVGKELELFTDDELNELKGLNKKERNIKIGLMMRKDKDLLDAIEKGIKNFVYKFCKENDIHQSDIVSLKKDAIFTIVPAKKRKFGDHIVFVEASKFSSFVQLNRIEFYYSIWEDTLTVKGLSKNTYNFHKDHFLLIIKRILKFAENSNYKDLFRFIKNEKDLYLNENLPPEYYFEMNQNCQLRLYESLDSYEAFTSNPNYPLDDIDISYNYITYIAPLIRILLTT
jgi:hypothetical protein